MNSKPRSKTSYLALTSLTLLIPHTLSAAIMWELTPNAAYTANTPITFTADPTINATAPAFTGIQVTASVDQAGNNFFANGAANGQLRFVNTNALNQGESITFNFTFNMQLFSGSRPFGVAGNTRSAALFHIDPAGVDAAGDIDGTALLTAGGNINTLQADFGTAPTVGALSHTNPNVLEFNNPADASVAVATNRAAFSSFPTSNSVEFTEGTDTTRFIVALADPGRSNADFSFTNLTFTYTNDSATPLSAGSAFIFTFAGQNPDAQIATTIPEPSTSLLIALTLVAFTVKRRR